MISHVFQFHSEMAAFPMALQARVNNSDVLYELFKDELFEPTGPPLLEYVTTLDPAECPLCSQEPVYSYARPEEQVGLFVSEWSLSTPCQLHGGTEK